MRLISSAVVLCGALVFGLVVKGQETPPIELLVSSLDPSPVEGAVALAQLNVPVANERGEFVFSCFNRLTNDQFKMAVMAGPSVRKIVAHQEDYWVKQEGDAWQLPPKVYFQVSGGGLGGMRLNDGGGLAFECELQAGYAIQWPAGVPLRSAVWETFGGSPSLITGHRGGGETPVPPEIPRVNNVLPNMDSIRFAGYNNNGWYVLNGTVTDGSPAGGTATYSGRGGSLSLVNYTGFTNVPRFRYSRIARDVDIGYATASSPTNSINSNDSLFRISGSSQEAVLLPGDALPGRPRGESYTYTLHDVDELGHAVFEARLQGHAAALGLWEASPTGVRLLVPFETEIPLQEGPLTIHSMQVTPPFSNVIAPVYAGRRLMFGARFTGFGYFNTPGVFKAEADGRIRLALVGGMRAPGTAYSFGTVRHDWQVSMNAQGTLAFLAPFSGGEPALNTVGLWVEDMAGVPRLVVHQGQMVDVKGTARAINTISTHAETALSDSGILLFRLAYGAETGIYRSEAPGAVDLVGSIRGKVRSALPTFTDEEHAVHRATITAYEQPAGRMRAQRVGETDGEYQAFVKSNLGRPVKTFPLIRADKGDFEIAGLKALKPANEGVLRDAFYTLEVASAETLEWGQTEQGGFDRTRTVPLHFLTKRTVNVRVPSTLVQINLQPLDEIGIKKALVENLSTLSPNNWAAIEAQVTVHLDNLLANEGAITDAQREALRRAIWAERAFAQAADSSSDIIKSGLSSLGTLLADIAGEFLKEESAHLKKAKSRVSKANELRDAPNFQTRGLQQDLRNAASEADHAMVSQAELAANMANTFKALKPYLRIGLEKAGMPPADAAKLADIYVLFVRSVFNVIKDAGMDNMGKGRAGLLLLIQEAVKFTVKETHPILMDAPPELGVSFSTKVAPTLQNAVDSMKGWQTYDEAGFAADREAFLRQLDEYVQAQSAIQQIVDWYGGLAEGFSNVGGAAVIGSVVKWVKVAEKATKVLKYASNIEAVVFAFVDVYKFTPDALKAMVRTIYHQPPPPAGMAPPQMEPMLAAAAGVPVSLAPPNDTAVREALAAIRSAAEIHNIGQVIKLALDRSVPTNLTASYDLWKRDYKRLEFTALNLPGQGGNDLPNDIHAMQRARADQHVAEARLGSALGVLFEGVLSGEFADVDAPAYLAARIDVYQAIAQFERSMANTKIWIDLVTQKVNGSTNGMGNISALVLEALPLRSQGQIRRTISAGGQQFEVAVIAFNAGTVVLPPQRVELQSWGLDDMVQIGSAVQTTPELAPGQSATLQWQLTCAGTPQGGGVVLSADLASDPPAAGELVVAGAEWTLLVDTSLADADLDGLPTTFEITAGLNPARDDAGEDPDRDGLSNLAEFELGTDPLKGDTDGDGVMDGAEIEGTTRHRTLPLVADSDGDGVDDGADGAPLDPNSTAPEAVPSPSAFVLSARRVILTPTENRVLVKINNPTGAKLLVRADPLHVGLVSAEPSSTLLTDGGTIQLSGPVPFPNLGSHGLLRTVVVVHNFAAGIPQSEEIEVILSLDGALLSAASEGENLVLTWPASLNNYVLEGRPALDGNGAWSNLGPGFVNGDERRVSLPRTTGAMFFRLRK